MLSVGAVRRWEKDGLPVPAGCIPSLRSKAGVSSPVKRHYSGLTDVPAVSPFTLTLWEGLIWRMNRASFKNAKVHLFSEIREEKTEGRDVEMIYK